MGASQRRKGAEEERKALRWWQERGVEGRRTAASGAQAGYRGDLEVELFEGLSVEVKSRKGGSGFVQLERWLGDCDLLQLRRNGQEPMFLLSAETFARFLEAARDIESITRVEGGPLQTLEGMANGTNTSTD